MDSFISKVTDLAIEFGNVLLPVIKDFLNQLILLHEPIKAWIIENKDMIATVTKWAVVLGPLLLAMGALGLLVGSLLAPIGTMISLLELWLSLSLHSQGPQVGLPWL